MWGKCCFMGLKKVYYVMRARSAIHLDNPPKKFIQFLIFKRILGNAFFRPFRLKTYF